MPENRQRTGNRGAFKPGKSGNPGGRPKLSARALEVRAACRAGSVRAVERLAELVESEDPIVALKAIHALMTRAWGEPGSEGEVRETDAARVKDAREREAPTSLTRFSFDGLAPPDVD